MDKFSLLSAFVAVVEAGSFSKAGDRLDLAKSVVSRRVTALERHLGTQLLQRTTRSLSLTEAGRQLFERAVRILADLDETEQALIDGAGELRGRLRIAAPLSFGLHHLRDALLGFMRVHPAVEIDLDLNDRAIDLVHEGFDVAIRIGELLDSTLVARRLGTCRFVTCASPDYLAAHGQPTCPADLADHAGLHYAHVPLSQAWRFARGDDPAEVALPTIRLRANNGDMLARAAAAGIGIVTSPTFIASPLVCAGDLVPVLADYQRPAVGIYALFPPGRLQPRRVRVFTDFLCERFGDLPAWDRALGITG